MPEPRWKGLATGLVFLGVVTLGLVLCIALTIAVLALMPGQMSLFEDSCAAAADMASEPACRLSEAVFTGSFYLLVPAGLAAFGLLRGISPADSLLLRSPGWTASQYVAFVALVFAASQGIELLLRLVSVLLGADLGGMNSDFAQPRQWLAADPVPAALMALLVVLLAPFTEEAVFRDFLFRPFLDTPLRAVLAGGILTLLWTLLHWSYAWQSLLAIGTLGLLFAYATWRTGSIWPAIAGHAANNLVAAVAPFLYQP